MSRKIYKWARIAQVSFWVAQFAESYLKSYVSPNAVPVNLATAADALLGMMALFLFTEAIVRILVILAKLLEK